jgi:hypothetical protein
MPTALPYTGPNYMQVTTDMDSCRPGAVSPYPYLDLVNTSTDTTLIWHMTISDPAFSLYHNPPNQLLPGWSNFIGFIGPMTATRPLTVTFVANIGYWSGTLQACSVATPVPPPPVAVTITCATAEAAIDAKLCVHVEAPPADVTIAVTYCDGTNEAGNAALSTGKSTDSQGNVLFDWIPNTTCYGPATVTVSATNYQNRHGTATTTLTVTGPPIGPTATPTPSPTSTPSPTPSPTP